VVLQSQGQQRLPLPVQVQVQVRVRVWVRGLLPVLEPCLRLLSHLARAPCSVPVPVPVTQSQRVQVGSQLEPCRGRRLRSSPLPPPF
jgi:hypothetical protein